MKNIKHLVFTVAVLASIVTACDTVDFGGVNQDDDTAKQGNAEALMAAAMNRYFTLTGSYHNVPTLYVQYQAQSVYTQEQNYGVTPYPWLGYYVQTLSNLNRVRDINSQDEISDVTRTYGAPVNQIGVSEIMSAMIWKRLTDTWGPVPYNEAFAGEENVTPAYTPQEEIYRDLIRRVKEARDMLDPSLLGPTGDPLYGGDIASWQRYANSFLMSLSLQLSERFPENSGFAATEFNAALNHSAGVIDEVSEEMWYDHANQPGMENPFSLYRGADYFLSEAFTDALQGTTPQDSAIVYSNSTFDNRLNIYSDQPDSVGIPYGVNGEFNGPSTSEAISGPDAPHHVMTAAYTYLNRADAANLGWTGESAQDMLETAIQMSYASLDQYYDDGDATTGLLQADGTAFAAARLADAANVGIEQVIGEEKWAALFPRGFQAWAEWRRTGYPALKPAPAATNSGEIPTRFLYPQNEGGSNAANYEEGVSLLRPAEDSNTAKVWWDVTPPVNYNPPPAPTNP